MPNPLLSLAMRLLRSRVTWGVGVAVGMLLAIAAHGTLRFREGKAAGMQLEALRRDSLEATATAAHDSVVAMLARESRAKSDSIHQAQVAAARAGERLAAAQLRYRQTLSQLDSALAADTTPSPIRDACTEFRSACELAQERANAVIDSLTQVATLTASALATEQAKSAGEPERTATAVRRAVRDDRATRSVPSRTKWALIGAGTLEALRWLGKVVRR